MFERMDGLAIDDRQSSVDGSRPDDTLGDPTFADLVEHWSPEDGVTAVGPQAPELPDLTEIAPSGALALELDWATQHPAALSAAELVDAAVGLERIAAWAMARQHAVLAAFHHHPDDGSIRHPSPSSTPSGAAGSADTRAWAVDEIGLALTLAPGAAATRMAHADRLDAVLRPTRDLLAAGKICPARARLIADLLTEHDDEVAAAVQARVLPQAPESTVGQLRAALIRAITAVVPDPEKRHKAARRERRVDLWPERDGMATLSACLTAPEATASFEWITRLARGLQSVTAADSGPARMRGSMDQRRADVMAALLTGRLVATTANTDTVSAGTAAGSAEVTKTSATGSTSSGPESAAVDLTTGTASAGPDSPSDPLLPGAPVSAHRPLIHITLPITSLMGIDDEPGELAGFGPIPAPLARQIANDPNSVWRRLLTDPVSGTLLDYGRTTYRPPAALAGFVRARDASCRFPGCRRPAASCELDHVQPWALDGTTSGDNLVTLCPRHHDTKEQPGWQVVLHPDRRMEWITPTGHHYWSRPVDHRSPRRAGPPPDPPAAPSPPTLPLRQRTFDELCALGLPDLTDPPPF